MATLTALCNALGVTGKTIRAAEKLGYTRVKDSSGRLDIPESIRAYVRFQSNRIREFSRQIGEGRSGRSEIDENKGLDYWKEEKEKQGAIKLQIQNEQALGELLPRAALPELVNSSLNFVRTNLTGMSGKVQKRDNSLDPNQLKIIDDVAEESLQALAPKAEDELRPAIRQIIRRYSKYHHSAEEDADNSMDERESES